MDSDKRLIDFWLQDLEDKPLATKKKRNYPDIEWFYSPFFGWFWYFIVLLLLILPTTGFSQVFLQPGSSTTVNCSSCPVCPTPAPVPVPTPVPTPIPTPVPTPQPTPLPDMFIAFATTMYYPQAPAPGTAADQQRLAFIKTYADVVMQFWYALPTQSYCNEARKAPTKVKVCGNYFDFGFLFTGDCFWNQAKQWKLGNAYNLYGATPTAEAVMNYASPGYADWYKNVLTNGCPGTNTAKAGSGENAMFLDNGIFDSTWFWNTYPISAAQNKINAKAFLTTVSNHFRANGDKTVLNVWSDVTATWANDPVFYRSVLNLVDYALFEVGVNDYSTGKPKTQAEALNYINKAYDYNTNTTTQVMWSTEYGNFWYQFTAGLLSCTSTKCMFWQQFPMTQANLDKIKALKIGTPVAPYRLQGCYVREFTKGWAVVNLTPNSCTFTLPAGTYDNLVQGGVASGSVTLTANTGNVFTKKPV